MAKKLTFEERKEILKKISPNIELINEFKNEKGKYCCTYKCSCGNIAIKNWNDLQSGKKACDKCSTNRILTFNERVDILKERNPEVILMSVIKDITKERYMCEFKTTFDETVKVREWTNLISLHKRIKDPKKKRTDNEKIIFAERQLFLKEHNINHELIESVRKKDKEILYYKYKCKCGSIVTNKWSNIKQNCNCFNCKETRQYSIEDKNNILKELG